MSASFSHNAALMLPHYRVTREWNNNEESGRVSPSNAECRCQRICRDDSKECIPLVGSAFFHSFERDPRMIGSNIVRPLWFSSFFLFFRVPHRDDFVRSYPWYDTERLTFCPTRFLYLRSRKARCPFHFLSVSGYSSVTCKISLTSAPRRKNSKRMRENTRQVAVRHSDPFLEEFKFGLRGNANSAKQVTITSIAVGAFDRETARWYSGRFSAMHSFGISSIIGRNRQRNLRRWSVRNVRPRCTARASTYGTARAAKQPVFSVEQFPSCCPIPLFLPTRYALSGSSNDRSFRSKTIIHATFPMRSFAKFPYYFTSVIFKRRIVSPEFLKHAIPDYIFRSIDPFSFRLSNKNNDSHSVWMSCREPNMYNTFFSAS